MKRTIAFLLLLSAPVIAQATCAQFGGWYIGGNIGWSHDDYQFDDQEGLGQILDSGLPNNIRTEDDGVIGGVQVGYNWQPCCCCSLLGLEADFSGTSLRPSTRFTDGDVVTQDTTTATNHVYWVGTVRGRYGVVADRLLLYATGGFAYAQTKQSWSFANDAPAVTETFNTNRVRVGGVGGFGAEWALGCCWSIKTEFLYVIFGQDRRRFTSGTHSPGVSYRFQSHESLAIGRVGVNYRWGC